MKIKNYTLKYINNGKDGKVYLRYFATVNGQSKTYDKSCDCVLSREDVIKLNSNSLGGLIQKECNKIKEAMVNDIGRFNVKNNTYPTPDQLRLYNNAIYSEFDIDYYTNQYYKSLLVKGSSKATYSYTLKKFKDYFVWKLYSYSIIDMINQAVIVDFGKWLIESRKHNDRIKHKDMSKISIYNSQVILFKYLNYIAKEFNINKIPDFLVKPVEGEKYHLTEEDVDRILAYKAKTFAQQEILNIIIINRLVGLRIGEILAIDKRNVEILTIDKPDTEIKSVCKIKFIEHEKSRVRTVVIVNQEAINIIDDHIMNDYNTLKKDNLFHFNDRAGFNRLLTTLCKKIFKEETVLIFKNTAYLNDYKEYLKYKVISSHAFRRYAIERNINEFGIETARTLSGHSDYATIIKHYSDFLNEKDLTEKLLRNNKV